MYCIQLCYERGKVYANLDWSVHSNHTSTSGLTASIPKSIFPDTLGSDLAVVITGNWLIIMKAKRESASVSDYLL